MVVAMVVAMVLAMELVDKETVAEVVAEKGNPKKIEIQETEIEMVTEMVIEHVLYVIVKEQKKMLVEAVMRQSYPMRMTSN